VPLCIQFALRLRYVKRRAKEAFHEHAAEVDASKLQQFWTKAHSELELVRRQAMVYTLFARKHKSIMVGMPTSPGNHV
jgi:LYR motif-containing protein 4